VMVNTMFNNSGTIQVTSGAHLKISSSGWCMGSGTATLGATGNLGGELEITGNWNHGDCFANAAGAGAGNLTFNPSSPQQHVLALGTYSVANVKAMGDATLWATQTVTIGGSLWLAGNAKLFANSTTINVFQNIQASGSATIEVMAATVNCAMVQFGSATMYTLHAATTTPNRLRASGQAAFAGSIRVVSQVGTDVNVTVVSYGSYTGAFADVSVEAAASPMAMSYSTSRRLLTTYGVEYETTDAHTYSLNGVSTLAPSLLFLGLIVSLIGFLY